MMNQGPNLGFILSLPERTLRALAVFFGGLVFEITEVLLPGWLRQSRLYRATIGGLLRIAIEFVGGLSGIIPPDGMDSQEFTMRKAAGTGVELASILTFGLSPMWLFAAAADITGGTRTFLDSLVSELQKDGILPKNADIDSVEELLDTLEGTSGQMADIIDIPPLNINDLRTSWIDLKTRAKDLPNASRLANLYDGLQQVARQEEQSVRSISSLITAGAARAGVQVGQTYIFDYYQEALELINNEGLSYYSKRVSRPYLMAAGTFFNPKRFTHTERLLRIRADNKDGL